jgi:CheY-like chemotaxis protein
VLLNLLDNAVKFTDAGGVTLAASVTGGSAARPLVRFEVRDTGIGVPAESREALFRAFIQADATISRRFGGTGLGLAICRRLVELMGGRIGLADRDGPGSTFWFTLPLPVSHMPGAEPAEEPGRAGPPLRILLAEDNEVNQMVAVGFMARRGHFVDVAGDGAEAVRMLQAGDYDVVLMDLHMPGMDGYEATRQIRGMPGAKGRIPIIAMTADAMHGDAERCLFAGMDDYVAKPVDPAALDAALARAAVEIAREPV